MHTPISINGTLTLDQSLGLQDDDVAIGSDLSELSAAFISFLDGLDADLTVNGLSTDQRAYADTVEAVVSGATFVTVTQDVDTTITNLFFSDADGDPLDGDQVFLDPGTDLIPLTTLDGDNVYLWSFGDFVIATTSDDPDAKGDVVAAFYLDESADHLSAGIEYVTFIPLAHPIAGDDSLGEHDDTVDWTDILNITATASLTFDFDELDSGNFLHVTVGTEQAGLLITALEPVIKADGSVDKQASETVNTSQGGTGATVGIDNQMFVPGKTGVFSFVEGQVPGTYTDIDDLAYDDFLDVKDGGIFISQVQGNPSTNYTLTISAFSAGGTDTDPEDGRSYLDNDLGSGNDLGLDAGDSALGDDTQVEILRVVVRDDTFAIVTDTTVDNAFVTFNADGSVTVEGLDAEWTVEWYVDDPDTLGFETFNRFHVEANEGKFDLGRVFTSEGVTFTEPVGDKLFVDDDGPVAALVDGGGEVTIDETAGLQTEDDDVAGTATLGGVALTTVFGGVANPGADGAAFPQYALSSTALVATTGSAVGTDEEGASTVLSLEIVNGNGSDSLLTTTDGEAIFLFEEDGLIVGRYETDGVPGVTGADDAAFAIALGEDGNVAVAQFVTLDNGDPTLDDEAVDLTGLVNAKVTVTDGDGDVDTAIFGIGDKINFEDDAPTAALIDGGGAVTVDETAGLQDDDVPDTATLGGTALTTLFGGVANPGSDGTEFPQYALSSTPLVATTGSAVGEDEEDATTVLSLEVVGGDGTDSGLTTTDGEAIFLFEEDGLIVGRYETDGVPGVTDADDAAFAIALSQDGNVAVAQFVTLDNGDPTLDDEAVDLTGLVNAKVTVTDGDGDVDTTIFGIGDKINFEDDAPTAALIDGGGEVTIDETAGLQDDDVADTATLGGVALTTLFSAVANAGADGTAFPQYALSSTALVATTGSAVGEDEESGASIVLSLEIVNGDGSDSLLTTTDGKAIVLFEENGLIVGRYDATTGLAGDVDGSDPAAFAIALGQDGNVAVAQFVTLDNGDPTLDDEAVDLTGLVNAKVTVTDGDGDVDTGIFGIGDKINFEDDAPTAALVDGGGEVTIDETAGLQGTDAAPDGKDEDNDDDDVDGTATLGGTALTTLFGGVANPGADGAEFPQYALSSTPLVATTGSAVGEDEEGATTVLSIEIVGGEGTDSGLTTTDGEAIFLFVEDGLIVGRYETDGISGVNGDDDAAFAIALGQDGNVAVAQFVTLDNGNPLDDDEAVDLTGLVNAKVTVTDGDGDVETAIFGIGDKINFEDDAPVAAITDTLEVVVHDESAGLQNTGTPNPDTGEDNDDDDQPGALPAAFAALGAAIGWATTANAVVSSDDTDFGTDGAAAAGSEVWSLDVPADNKDSGFIDLDGNKILLNVENGIVVGRISSDGLDVVTQEEADADGTGTLVADPVAIAIAIDQEGILSFAQYLPFAHLPDTGPDQQAAMNDGALLAVLTVTDGDGDTHVATEEIGDKVIVEDDAPLVAQLSAETLEEDDLTGGNNDNGSTDGFTATIDLDVGSIVLSGADEPVTFSLKDIDASDVLPQLYSKGEALTYVTTLEDNKIEAFADYGGPGERLVFTFVLTDDGLGNFEATLSLNDQLDHVFGDNLADPSLQTNGPSVDEIDFSGLISGADKDGDPIEVPDIAFEIGDDLPIFTDPIVGGTVDFELGDSFTESLNGSVGTDENDADALTGDGVTKTYTFAFLNDTNGDSFFDATDTILSTSIVGLKAELSDDSTLIQYFTDGDSDGNLPGVFDGNDILWFSNELDQDGAGSYTFTAHQPPVDDAEFDFNDLPANQSLFGLIAEDKTQLGEGDLALAIIPTGALLKDDGNYVTGGAGGKSSTINTSKGGGPVTIAVSNQLIDKTGEGVYFVYVTDPDDDAVAGVGTGLSTAYDDADNLGFGGTQAADGASYTIVQNSTLAQSRVTAYDIDPSRVGDPDTDTGVDTSSDAFILDPDDGATVVSITAVQVYDEDGTLLESVVVNDLGEAVLQDIDGDTIVDDNPTVSITFFDNGGGIYSADTLITKKDSNYTIEFDTAADHDMALVSWVGGTFDIGGFNIAQSVDTPDQEFEFAVNITDFDGDSDTSNVFSVDVDGTGAFDSGEFENGEVV